MSEQSVIEHSPAPIPLPDVVQRYLNGETLESLAKEQGKTYRQLYYFLLTDKAVGHDDLITECLTSRVADADLSMDTAHDSVSLARAREAAKFARMDLERRRPKLYGPKQEVSTDSKITVIVQRDRPQPVVVDGKTDDKLTVITDAQVIPQ